MTKETILKTIFGLLFISLSIYFFRDYFDFKSEIVNNKLISYSFIEKKINKGGRGESYDMIFFYNRQKHSISITSTEYYLIEEGKFPKLYLSKKSNSIFSVWSIKRSLRLGILFLSLSIISVFPYSLFRKFFSI